MSDTKQRGDAATAGVGYGLAAAGGGISQAGIGNLKRVTGMKNLHAKPLASMIASRRVAGTGKARALYAGGRLVTAIGGAGAVAGTTAWTRDHRLHKADSLLEQGIRGQVDAVKEKVKPTKPTPLKAHIMSLGLGAAGAAAGAGVAGKFTQHLPIRAVAAAASSAATVPVANKINSHFKVRNRKGPKRPSSKSSSIEARPSRGADMRQARTAIVPVTKMNDASEVHVNGALEATGRKRLRTLTPYEQQNTRGRVKKLDNGYTAAEARRQLGRKKRKLVADVANTGLGLSGLALLGASHPASGLKAVHRAKLARAASTSAVLSGGVSGITGIQGARISTHDIKAQERVLKAYGIPRAPRIPGFRSSYLQTRRLSNGTLKATRVNGGAVR